MENLVQYPCIRILYKIKNKKLQSINPMVLLYDKILIGLTTLLLILLFLTLLLLLIWIEFELFVFIDPLLWVLSINILLEYLFIYFLANGKYDLIWLSHFNVYEYYYVDFFIGGKYPINFTQLFNPIFIDYDDYIFTLLILNRLPSWNADGDVLFICYLLWNEICYLIYWNLMENCRILRFEKKYYRWWFYIL